MVEIKGNLFSTSCPVIGHGCNCKGVWGAGIAKTFALEYPNSYKFYRYVCNSVVGTEKVLVGSSKLFNENDKYVACIFTQIEPGPNAKLEYIESALNDLKHKMKSLGLYEVSIPKIGCGIGGLKWEEVKRIVEKVFRGSEITVFVYDNN